MKRWIALILTLSMVLSFGILPAAAETPKEVPTEAAPYVYTEADNAAIEDDVFAGIEQIRQASAEIKGGVSHLTEQDYIALIPQVIKKIENSSTYVPGSLQQNGNFLVWETTVGIPCCYDPRMEAELHNTENDPTPAEIARAEAAAAAILEAAEPVRGGPTSINIGLIQPYWESSSNYADGSFNNYSPQYKAMWQSLYEATGGTGLRYSMSNATVDNIGLTMSQCALVMFDSHGTTDYSGSNGDYTSRANSSYLCLTTNSGVTSADTAAKTGPYGTYYDCIKGSGYAYVNGTCIANHMPNDAPNSYLYMGICLGMATDKMEAGLRDKGVEVVYGYSQSVTFAGDMDYMNSLNTAVKNGDDIATAVANMKTAVGVPDPYTSSYPAWPIVVSSEDPYPGHGNVDQAQTVNSTWSLFGTNYAVTASSNNEAWGTVEVRGSNILAHPADGYYAAGYTLLSGTATVTQNGSIFLVQAETDCSVQINFAAKTPAVVNYYSNSSACGTENTYVGDDVVLPADAPEIFGYRFRGWVEAPVYETNEKPAYLKPGASYTVQAASVNLYALYSCVIGSGGIAYQLVTETPDDWEGNYVISGTKTGTIKVLKALASGGGYENDYANSVVNHTDAGMEFEDDLLREVGDDYIWVVETSGSGYTIRNLGNDTYLGCNGYSLYSLEGVSGNSAFWTLSFAANVGTKAANAASSSYPYLVFYSNTKFALYGETVFNQYPVQFWKETEDGETYYYTEVTPHEHQLVYVEAVEPNCTENGNIAHWRCELCGKCFTDAEGENEIPAASVVLTALGHTPGEPVTENETAPTCGVDGGYDTVLYCTVCQSQISRTHVVVPATGDHNYGAWSTNHNGTHSRVCAVCQGVDTVDCTYEDAVTPPTPADQGYTTHTCTVCGYSFNDSFTPALGFDYTVHFSVPEGVEQPADMVSNTNTGINLPVVSAPDGYTFLGWVTDRYANVTAKPADILTGRYIAPTEITLNALFVFYEGGEANFVLMTAAPEDWVGNYVVTYGADAAYVLRGIEAGLSYEAKKNGGAVLLADTGMELNGDTLVNVSRDYVFAAEAHGSVYGFRSVVQDSYLAAQKITSWALKAAAEYGDDCGWSPSVAADGVVSLVNPAADANRSFFSFFKTSTGSSYYFRVWSSVDQIRLWKEICTGTPYYTTVLSQELHEHTPGEPVEENRQNPTCTEAGSYDLVVYCTACGEELSRETVTLDPLGHDYQAVITAPTCTEAGFTTYTCSRCGDSYTGDETAALGHDYQAVVTEPTCTDAGFTTYTCSRCGDSYTGDETAALGHDWDEGVVTLEPTTEVEGVRTYTCLRCGETKTEAIPMLEQPPFRFDDVQDENAFYFDPVYWAYNHVPQITKGTDPTHFSPNNKCTRAEAVTFLWRAANCPSYEAAENPFQDVSTNAWYYDAVMWAYAEGITKGTDGTHFAPGNTCSRAEIVTFLMRAQKGSAPEDAENPFVDVGNNSWYREAVLWAVSEGITKGVNATHFAPNKVCTRGEIVTFLYRAYAD